MELLTPREAAHRLDFPFTVTARAENLIRGNRGRALLTRKGRVVAVAAGLTGGFKTFFEGLGGTVTDLKGALRWLDVNATGKWLDGPDHQWRYNRDYGSAVMYEPGKILFVGGGGNPVLPSPHDSTTSVPTNTAEIIDLTQPAPQWRFTGSMQFPRRHLNATILPDGQVLVAGGTQGGGFDDVSDANAAHAAEVWDPGTGQWTTLASNTVTRSYHSVSVLLPDGRIVHAASGDADVGGTPAPAQRNSELFSPPYLFKGARPIISSAPSGVAYGERFMVETPNSAQITKVTWVRLGSVTHSFDQNQRFNTLAFGATRGGLIVTAPTNPNLAPPGHYALFVLNRNGVPSVGKIIRIQ